MVQESSLTGQTRQSDGLVEAVRVGANRTRARSRVLKHTRTTVLSNWNLRQVKFGHFVSDTIDSRASIDSCDTTKVIDNSRAIKQSRHLRRDFANGSQFTLLEEDFIEHQQEFTIPVQQVKQAFKCSQW